MSSPSIITPAPAHPDKGLTYETIRDQVTPSIMYHQYTTRATSTEPRLLVRVDMEYSDPDSDGATNLWASLDTQGNYKEGISKCKIPVKLTLDSDLHHTFKEAHRLACRQTEKASEEEYLAFLGTTVQEPGHGGGASSSSGGVGSDTQLPDDESRE